MEYIRNEENYHHDVREESEEVSSLAGTLHSASHNDENNHP